MGEAGAQAEGEAGKGEKGRVGASLLSCGQVLREKRTMKTCLSILALVPAPEEASSLSHVRIRLFFPQFRHLTSSSTCCPPL